MKNHTIYAHMSIIRECEKLHNFYQWNYNVMLYSHEKLGGDMIHQSMQNSYAAGLGHTCKFY